MISKRVFQVCRAPGKTPCDLDKHWKPFVSRSAGPEQSDHKSYKRSLLRCFDQLIILQVRLLYNPLHCDRQGWNFQRWFEVGLKDKVRKQVQVKETSTIIHTSYLSRTPRIYSCKFFLAGVIFYRFNAKNWQFTVYFGVITQKIGNFLCILS